MGKEGNPATSNPQGATKSCLMQGRWDGGGGDGVQGHNPPKINYTSNHQKTCAHTKTIAHKYTPIFFKLSSNQEGNIHILFTDFPQST